MIVQTQQKLLISIRVDIVYLNEGGFVKSASILLITRIADNLNLEIVAYLSHSILLGLYQHKLLKGHLLFWCFLDDIPVVSMIGSAAMVAVLMG